jgi:hypothetical protein
MRACLTYAVNSWNNQMHISDEVLQLSPRTLVFFIDESGDEHLSDHAHPIFGYAGIALRVDEIERQIRRPWTRLKNLHFGEMDGRLHAGRMRQLSQVQMTALSDFFVYRRFSRFAAFVHRETKHHGDLQQPVGAGFGLHIALRNIAADYPRNFDGIALIFEDSQRGNPVVEQLVGTPGFELNGSPIPVEYAFMPNQGDCEMEVADFVAHTAGQHMKQTVRDGFSARRDFIDTFRNYKFRPLCYFNIDEIEARREGSDWQALK